MSDRYDHLLAGLSDEDEEATEEAQESQRDARKAREAKGGGRAPRAAEATESRQRGKRNDPNYEQVNAFIRKEIKPTLFFYLKSDGRTLSDLIEEKLEEYVEEHGGVIKATRRKE